MSTPAESDDYFASLPTELREPYTILWKDVYFLHSVWKAYLDLYGTTPKRIDILNQTAGAFFGLLQNALGDHIQLLLSRLAESRKTGEHENLTLDTIVKLVDENGDLELAQALAGKRGLVVHACHDMNKSRNKRIAHRDFDHATGVHLIAPTTRANIAVAVGLVEEFMATVEEHYMHTTCPLSDVIGELGDAESLLRHVWIGLRFHEMFERGELAGDQCVAIMGECLTAMKE